MTKEKKLPGDIPSPNPTSSKTQSSTGSADRRKAKDDSVLAEKNRIVDRSRCRHETLMKARKGKGEVEAASSSDAITTSSRTHKAGLRGRNPPAHEQPRVQYETVPRVTPTSQPQISEDEEENDEEQGRLVEAEVVEEQSILQAEIVEKDAVIMSQEDSERSKRRRRWFLVLFVLVVICASSAIVLGVSLGTKGSDDGSGGGGGDYFVPSSAAFTSDPASDITQSPIPNPCFASREELVSAVDGLFSLASFEVGTDIDPRTTYGDPIGSWCVSGIQNLTALFSIDRNADAARIKSDLSGWDMSAAIDISEMFYGAASFNGDVTNWDTSRVRSMRNLFHGATAFNQNLSKWNVGSVTDFYATFYKAYSFNGDVTAWNTSSAQALTSMFGEAMAFNQDISGWKVQSVTDMAGVFAFAALFNQDLSSWDISGVCECPRDINGELQIGSFWGMFKGASSFRQDLCSWGSRIQNSARQEFIQDMFVDTGCPVTTAPLLYTTPKGPFCFSCS